MSYCVNCGVELAEYIKKCPLCNTEVINPNSPYNIDSEIPYTEYIPSSQKTSPRTLLAILAIVFLLPCSICVTADIMYSGTILWSGYVIGGLFALYTIIASALLVHPVTPVLGIIFDIFAVLLLTVYISSQTGGKWFSGIALPLICYCGICTVVLTLYAKLLKITALRLCSYISILTGILVLITEFTIDHYLYAKINLKWSLYPLISLIIIGTILIFIDKNKSLKRRLIKRIFI